jgi:hypothetical protein
MTAMETAVRIAVGLLVKGQYDVLAAVTRGRRLPAEAMAAAVAGYGRTLVQPPADWWSSVNITQVVTAPNFFLVAAPLWTEEEGESDLTLELRLERTSVDVYDIEVLDIHVL